MGCPGPLLHPILPPSTHGCRHPGGTRCSRVLRSPRQPHPWGGLQRLPRRPRRNSRWRTGCDTPPQPRPPPIPTRTWHWGWGCPRSPQPVIPPCQGAQSHCKGGGDVVSVRWGELCRAGGVRPCNGGPCARAGSLCKEGRVSLQSQGGVQAALCKGGGGGGLCKARARVRGHSRAAAASARGSRRPPHPRPCHIP